MSRTAPCPCCTNEGAGDFDDLCDTCAAAAMDGIYPHGCARTVGP